MKRIIGISSAALTFGLTLFARPAAAQDVEGAFQLGLGTSILTYESITTTVETAAGDQDTDSSTTTWGVRDEVVGELGYGLTESLVLGGFVQLGGSSTTTEPEGGEETETSEFGLFLGPKLDFMFMPGQKVQPFVGAVAGLAMASADNGAFETSLTGFQLMGRAGIRAFLADSFSLDPALALSWVTASGEADSGPVNVDISASGFTIGVMLGVSGWL